LLVPFRLGVGGRLGDGRQYLPWIAVSDWLDAMQFLLASDLAGPVNLVGPDPVRNRDFTRELARAVHRPALIPVPAIALRLAVGEFGREAVASQRVLPGVLVRSGFAFAHPDVATALTTALAG
jgi:NAD dependent epimerase/dehydratase family enzyme